MPLIGLVRSHQAAAWCDGIARAQCNERSVSDTAPYQRPCRFANYKFATVRPSRIKKRRETSRLFLVPLIGLEPIRCRHRGILSPLRLPFRHSGIFCLFSLFLGGLEDALDEHRSFVCHSATAAYYVLFSLLSGGLEDTLDEHRSFVCHSATAAYCGFFVFRQRK